MSDPFPPRQNMARQFDSSFEGMEAVRKRPGMHIGDPSGSGPNN